MTRSPFEVFCICAFAFAWPVLPLILSLWGVGQVAFHKKLIESAVETTGEVIASTVEKRDHTDEEGESYSTYWPQITFVYLAEGRSFKSGTLAPEATIHRLLDAHSATELVEDHPIGSVSNAWFDSRDPAVAYLELGEARDSRQLLVFGLGYLLGLPLMALVVLGVIALQVYNQNRQR